MRRRPLQVVLDTSVLIAALRSRNGASFRLLTMIGDKRWRINLSPALVFEYEEVARREAQALWAKPGEVEGVLDYLCRAGRRPRISYAWRPFLSDPDDEMIVELAVAAGAATIITHNTRDFLPVEKLGLRVATPREFLHQLNHTP